MVILRSEFLTSILAMLGLGRLFPSLLRTESYTTIYDVTWDADGPDIGTMTVRLEYDDGDGWVCAGSATADAEHFRATLPMDYEGDNTV